MFPTPVWTIVPVSFMGYPVELGTVLGLSELLGADLRKLETHILVSQKHPIASELLALFGGNFTVWSRV